MPFTESLSYTGDLVRRYDRDRFLTALFAPPAIRERLLTLYAFNVEIARIPETVTEPLIGEMRLQWWRNVLASLGKGEPAPKGHPVAEPLAALILDADLPIPLFMTLLNAREQDLAEHPPESLETLNGYCQDTSASLSLLALEAMDITDDLATEAATSVGIAWALTGIARSVRHMALVGRTLLPHQLMTEAGLSVQDLQSPEKAKRAGPIIRAVANHALHHLERARATENGVDLRALPVLLPATLASYYLRMLERCNYDIYHPRLKNLHPPVLRLWWNAWRKRY